jgi:hypothetical protein
VDSVDHLATMRVRMSGMRTELAWAIHSFHATKQLAGADVAIMEATEIRLGLPSGQWASG